MTARAEITCALVDAAATENLGAELSSWVRSRPGGMVYLHGDLGAGKTTLMRGLLRALGVVGAIRSPTYTLIETYEIKGICVIHADLYRLNDPRELYALGQDDFPPDTTWWWVEWPQRGAGVLPAADASISLSISGEGRVAIIVPPLNLSPG